MSATKGWKGALKIADSEAELAAAVIVGYVDNVDTNLDGGLEEVFHLNSRLPKMISEGNVKMKLSITKKFVNSDWAGYAGIGQTNMLPPTKYLGLYPFGYSAGNIKVVAKGKCGNWRLSMPQADYVTEAIDFVVETLSIGTV
jgi:hypothetical protein